MVMSRIEAYTLGVLVGDGYVGSSRRTSYQLALKTRDEDFADAFKVSLEQEGLYPRKRWYTEKGTGYSYWRVWAYSKRVAFKYIRLLNQLENLLKTESKTIVAAFIRGVFDSEGSATKRKDGAIIISFSNTNIKLLETLKTLLLNHFGIHSYIYLQRKAGTFTDFPHIKKFHVRRTKNAYSLEFNHRKNARTFAEQIGTSISRKEKVMKYVKS